MKSPLVIVVVFIVLGAGRHPQALGGDSDLQAAHRTGPYILGADISWVQEDEANGSVYYDGGQQKDIFQILKEYGFNYIRLRVFVDPASPLARIMHGMRNKWTPWSV